MLQTVRAQKIDEKMGHLSSFHVSFLSYDLLNCLKKTYFAILCCPQQEI